MLEKVIRNIVYSHLHIKEHLDRINYCRKTDDGYEVNYTYHESDDGIQYPSENKTIIVTEEEFQKISIGIRRILFR